MRRILLFGFAAAVACGGVPDGQACFEDSDCSELETCVVNVFNGRTACIERCREDAACTDGGPCIEYPPKEVAVEGVLRLCGRP